MNDYTISFKRSEPKPMWSYPLSLVEYEAEIEMLKSRIAELEAERRWIPVSERLPENNQQVLSTDGEDYYLDYYAQWDGANLSFAPRFLGATWKVTHWMPLPESPGGEG